MRSGFLKAQPSILRETRDGKRDPAAEAKDQDETTWEKELYKLFVQQNARIQAALEPAIPDERKKAAGDPASVLDDDFWANEEELFYAVIVTLMTDAAQSGLAIETGVLESSFSISADWTLASAEAAAWAREHSAELVAGMTKTTARSVGEMIATWIETPGSTMGQLFDSLSKSYALSENRARNIGVTEVTNSYSEGRELAYADGGIPTAVYKPTAHVNCRCWDAAILLADNTWVVVWRTNRDELVCKQPLDTPWGVVGGCRGLENIVISPGEFLGENLREARAAAREREE